MTHRIRIAAIGALAAAAIGLPALAQTHVVTALLPAPAVMRIPASAAVPTVTINSNAPIMNGEFSTAVRSPSDRAQVALTLRAQRAADAARFATGAGQGVAVQLRHSRY